MITFFRKLRKKFIGGGNVRKYLLYAVGEIMLVVVGILIALQVNNWNEERKAKILETEVLKELSSDMQQDILSLENDVALNKRFINSILIIKKALNSDQAYHDSLGAHFATINFNTTYTMKISGYENLKSIGLQVITEDQIRKAITDLYASVYSFLKETEEAAELAMNGHFSPKYISHFKSIRTRSGMSARRNLYTPVDFEALKEDVEFSLLLDYNRSIKEENLFNLGRTLPQIKDTKTMIDDYLNSTN